MAWKNFFNMEKNSDFKKIQNLKEHVRFGCRKHPRPLNILVLRPGRASKTSLKFFSIWYSTKWDCRRNGIRRKVVDEIKIRRNGIVDENNYSRIFHLMQSFCCILWSLASGPLWSFAVICCIFRSFCGLFAVFCGLFAVFCGLLRSFAVIISTPRLYSTTWYAVSSGAIYNDVTNSEQISQKFRLFAKK